jgi:hypothetical protein
VVCGIFGFAAGIAMSRIRAMEATAVDPVAPPAAATSTAIPTPPPSPTPTAAPAAAPTPKAAPKPAPRAAAPKPRPKPAQGGTGVLSVIAPLDAEVLLDGKPIGKGILRKEIPAGDHRVEVRYGGDTVSEKFRVLRGETWTYEVSPTEPP